jgi:hypothetical protein
MDGRYSRKGAGFFSFFRVAANCFSNRPTSYIRHNDAYEMTGMEWKGWEGKW